MGEAQDPRAVAGEAWSVRAVNLPEHAGNAIHTDAGAQAAGFRAALVAGVTTYAYLTHVPAASWGSDWLTSGTAEVRFESPIVDGDRVDCSPQLVDDVLRVDAVVADEVRATARFTRIENDPPASHGAGSPLESAVVRLTGEWADYGSRAGDDLQLYTDLDVVHPAVWPALANHAIQHQLVDGPWIHTRSRIQHHGTAAVGSVAVVDATIVDRFTTRAGERAVLDVTISVGDRPVATLEHEAIVRLST